MKRKVFVVSLCLIAYSFVFITETSVYAHPGRTDARGGHYNRSTGVYHYHTGGSSSSSSSTSDSSYSHTNSYEDDDISSLKQEIYRLEENMRDLEERIASLENRYYQLLYRYNSLNNNILESPPSKSFTIEKMQLAYQSYDSNVRSIIEMDINLMIEKITFAKTSVDSYQKELDEYENYINKIEDEINNQVTEENSKKEVNDLINQYNAIRNLLKSTFGIVVPEYKIDYSIDLENIKQDIILKNNYLNNLYSKRLEQIKKRDKTFVYIDGLLVDAETYVIDGITYIELRKILENLSFDVVWNSHQKEIIISKDQNVFRVFLNQKVAYCNLKEISLTALPMVSKSKTFLPVRFLREAMGIDVYWDATHNAVLVETNLKGEN